MTALSLFQPHTAGSGLTIRPFSLYLHINHVFAPIFQLTPSVGRFDDGVFLHRLDLAPSKPRSHRKCLVLRYFSNTSLSIRYAVPLLEAVGEVVGDSE